MTKTTSSARRWTPCTAAFLFGFFCLSRASYGQDPAAPVLPAASASRPVPGSISLWPAADSIAPGTTVFLETARYGESPYECKVQNVDDRGITCRGPHRRPITYERELVHTISIRTQHLRHAYIGFVITGALLTGGGLACALAGGGIGCGVVLVTGLGTGLVAGILHSIYELRTPGEPTPIYIAPLPPTPANELE